MKIIDKLKKLIPHKKKTFADMLKERKFWVLAVMMIVLVVLFYPKPENGKGIPILIKGVTVRAEVADTMFEKSRGLMNRKKLSQNEGMLFAYNFEGKHSFWMKNTLIPLDIIWINAQKEVVHIEHSAPPCKRDPCPSYISPYKAQYVLELNGGWSIENNLGLGDRISFSY